MHALRLCALGALSGLLLALALLYPLAAAPNAHAQLPRPTLTVAPRPTLEPSPPTEPPDTSRDDREGNGGTPQQTGRITGTVIEQTSGAPTAGIIVRVGGAIVLSDTNGNYDRTELPPGDYLISLDLTADQGVATQEPRQVTLAPGATMIIHLSFTRNTAVILPSATPIAATSEPAHGATPPHSLPNTGTSTGVVWPIWWLLAGMIALIGGAIIQLTTRVLE